MTGAGALLAGLDPGAETGAVARGPASDGFTDDASGLEDRTGRVGKEKPERRSFQLEVLGLRDELEPGRPEGLGVPPRRLCWLGPGSVTR